MLGPVGFALNTVAITAQQKMVGDSIATLLSELDTTINYDIPLPRVEPGSDEFRYHILRLAGRTDKEACELVKCTPKTAEHWRADLRNAARARYGFRVEYHRVARDVTDYELYVLQGRQLPSRLTGKK